MVLCSIVKDRWQHDLRATVWSALSRPYHLHLRITALAIGSETVIGDCVDWESCIASSGRLWELLLTLYTLMDGSATVGLGYFMCPFIRPNKYGPFECST
ncbi:hypothetical protein K492DRAFT_38245 [Lichtheimia hyalospora FSU 10163]|nr:hypothetical protein K492DRAFT_38245 [Lichtheimia hyalospora FSU 10163]